MILTTARNSTPTDPHEALAAIGGAMPGVLDALYEVDLETLYSNRDKLTALVGAIEALHALQEQTAP